MHSNSHFEKENRHPKIISEKSIKNKTINRKTFTNLQYENKLKFDKNVKTYQDLRFSKKNLVQFRDSTGRVIASLSDPKSWNSANVTLTRQDDAKRYVQNLHNLGYLKKGHVWIPTKKKNIRPKQQNAHYTLTGSKKDNIIFMNKRQWMNSSPSGGDNGGIRRKYYLFHYIFARLFLSISIII